MKYAVYISFSMLLTVCHAAADESVTKTEYGKITGSVVLSELIQPLKPLFDAGAEIKDREVCGGMDMPDERLVFDAKTGGVENAFVWISKVKPGDIHPSLRTPKPSSSSLTFEGCRFRPHVLCVQLAQRFHMVSKDSLAHNPHDYPVRNSPACTLLSPAGEKDTSFRHYFRRSESIPIVFKCDYHNWMSAYVLVQDHPYMTTTACDGSFSIENLPYGEHRLVIWHEAKGYLFRDLVELDQNQLDLGITEFELTDDVRKTLDIRESMANVPPKR